MHLSSTGTPQLPSLSPPQPALVVSILFLTLALLIGISVWLGFHVDSDQHGITCICESSTYLLIGSSAFFLLHCKHSLYIPAAQPFSDVLFVNSLSFGGCFCYSLSYFIACIYVCGMCNLYGIWGVCLRVCGGLKLISGVLCCFPLYLLRHSLS